MIVALAQACADPAANKTKATVTNAQAESNTSKPAGAEKLVISPDNSKVEFVAAKVTRSHNGSFKQFAGSMSHWVFHVKIKTVEGDLLANNSCS